MLITTEQAKEFLKINSTLKEETFSPFIPDAEEKYIKPFLGDELFSLLETWADEQSDDDAEMVALYPKVIPALARFSMLLAAPHMDLNIGESGFGVVSTGGIAPASRERVKEFTKSLEELAWGNIENLLRFLEENQEDYPDWVDSDAYTMHTRNLINSAENFNNFVEIDRSRLIFHRLRKHMDNVEEIHVQKLISPDLYEYLIGALREGLVLSDYEIRLLAHLRAFVANKVAAENLDRKTESIATYHFNEAKNLINKYPDEFPLYRDSDYYDTTLDYTDGDPFFSDYDQDEESSLFMGLAL